MTTRVDFLLSPAGHLIDVPLNHVGTAIAESEKFGLTPAEIFGIR